jgi:cephalosporin hydroxylase
MNIKDVEKIYDGSVLWQMSPAERTILQQVLSKIDKKNSAIEIGSFCGGSLRSLSQHFKKVYSCDVTHSCIVNIEQFTNVEFILGNSALTVPILVENINNGSEEIGLVIIDADHEYNGVYTDIQSISKLKPKKDMIILIHDSWYTPSRKAICDFDWNICPHVHFIDTDFCAGDLISQNMTMGGLALIVISPELRQGDIKITKSQDFMYRTLNNV